MDDALIKQFLLAAVAIAGLIVAAIGFVYVGLPLAIIVGIYLGYKTYKESSFGVSVAHERKLVAAHEAVTKASATLPGEEAFNDTVRSTFLGKIANPTLHPEISFRLLEIGKALYRLETTVPAMAEPSAAGTKLALARQLDATTSFAQRLSLPDYCALIERPVLEAFCQFAETLPPIAFMSNADAIKALEGDPPAAMFHLPLLSVLPNAGRAVEALILPFFTEDLIQKRVHALLRDQLTRNQHQMSGVPYTIDHYESPKLVRPLEYEGTPFQTVVGYLNQTPFPFVFDAPLPLNIPEHLRFEGTWIIAPPGRGKTTLLSALLKADLDLVKDGKASLILMDSKGDLIDHARELAEFAGPLKDRLVLIEPTGDLALNPLDLGKTAGHTISLLEYVFSGLMDATPTPLQATLFRAVLLAMQAIPNATFDTFRRFLTEGWQPFEEYIQQMHPDDRAFFFNGEFASKTYAETRQQLLWRIRDLTTRVPLIRDMFKAPKTKIDIGGEMDAGRVIIIDNSAAKLAGGSEFFSRFFVALVLAAAQERAGRAHNAKLPCFFYIDEADTVIARDTNIASILDRCRSQKIGLVLAHQRLQQIKSEDVKDALANCAVRIANSDDDAALLAPRLRTTTDALRGLSRGQFLLFMRDCMSQALAVSVPNDPVSGWPKMTRDEMAEIRREMKRRFHYIRDEQPPSTPTVHPSPPGGTSPEPTLGKVSEASDKPAPWNQSPAVER